MNSKRTFPKFLATFDQTNATKITPPNDQPPPANQQSSAQQQQTPVTFPVEVLGTIIDWASRANASGENLRRIQAQTDAHNQVQSPPVVPIAPPPPPAAITEVVLSQISSLAKTVDKIDKRQQANDLADYRFRAINASRAAGNELIEDLVMGRNPQEIDAAIAYAVATYNNLHAQWQKQQQQPSSVIAPPQNQSPDNAQPPLVGVVTQQAVVPTPQQTPGVPMFHSPAGGAFPEQPSNGVIDPGALTALTSTDAIRNGQYGANRAALMHALRTGAPMQGQQVAFVPGYSVAPPVPRAPAQAPLSVNQPMAMGTNPYAGVQLPSVRTQQGILQQQAPGVPQRQAPQMQGFTPQNNQPPQPADFDNGGAPDAAATAAAAAAAQTAIEGRRNWAARMPSIHQ